MKSLNVLVLAAVAIAVFAFTSSTIANAQSANRCISAVSGQLGDVTIINRCSAPVDVKFCYMQQDGSDAQCRLLSPLGPGFQESTPQCFRCSYKTLWESAFSSEHAAYRFSDDEYILARLGGR